MHDNYLEGMGDNYSQSPVKREPAPSPPIPKLPDMEQRPVKRQRIPMPDEIRPDIFGELKPKKRKKPAPKRKKPSKKRRLGLP